MEPVCFSICGGLWNLRAVNMFMPPLDKLSLNAIPAGNLKAYYFPKMLPKPPRMLPKPPVLLLPEVPPRIMPNMPASPDASMPLPF